MIHPSLEAKQQPTNPKKQNKTKTKHQQQHNRNRNNKQIYTSITG
jgi:hypothetical protein